MDVKNKVPEKNPCKDMPDDLYETFRKALSDTLAEKSGVLKDIQTQIDDALKKADVKPKKIEVEIFLVTLEEFIKEYAEDVAQDKAKSEADARSKFKDLNAYTYIMDKKTIKIKIFCKRSVIDAVIENDGEQHPLYRLIVHELVHAKLFSTTLSELPQDKFSENLKKEGRNDGTAPEVHPGDHNDQLSREVDRLLDGLLKKLKKEKDEDKQEKDPEKGKQKKEKGKEKEKNKTKGKEKEKDKDKGNEQEQDGEKRKKKHKEKRKEKKRASGKGKGRRKTSGNGRRKKRQEGSEAEER